MKRYAKLTSFVLICCTVLCGCSESTVDLNPDEMIREYLLHDDPQYKEYLSLKELHSDAIDENGYYIDDTIAESEKEDHAGMIHVSFASNSLLNVNYYADSEYSTALKNDGCYLNPGDSIFAKVDSTSLIQSNTYSFSGFQIVGINGDKVNYNFAHIDGNKITIPNDIQYSEISIIPVGNYQKRDLTFQAEYRDEQGNTLPISPIWTVSVGNNDFSTKSDSHTLDANAAFRVKAQYDLQEYYLIDSEPKYDSVTENTEDGISEVCFQLYDAQNAVNGYKLIFGKTFPIEIESVTVTGKVSVWVDGKEIPDVQFPFHYYGKLGSTVKIESKSEIKEKDIKGISGLLRLTQNGYVYSICNEADAFSFDPSEYTYANGKVLFYDIEHKPITDKIEMKIGDVLYYKGEPNEGYLFMQGEGEHKLTIDANIKYLLKNEISFNPKQTIPLPQPAKGGTIVYSVNGKQVSGDKVGFTPGTDKLTASFKPADRYMVNNLSDNAECVVTENSHMIHIKNNDGNEISIDDIFKISNSQKASLSVKLDESVGTEIKFNIYDGDGIIINEDKKSYINKSLLENWNSISDIIGLDDNELLKNKLVDTVSGIKIAVSDWSPLRNEAIKIEVVKKDAQSNKTNEVYYILSGSGSQFISTDSGDSTYYKTIDINISKVTGSVFNSADYTYDHANVAFYFDDVTEGYRLADGDFSDNDRKIRMVVTAQENYQVFKKSAIIFSSSYNPVDSYEDTFKYSKIQSEFSDMLSETRIQS